MKIYAARRDGYSPKLNEDQVVDYLTYLSLETMVDDPTLTVHSVIDMLDSYLDILKEEAESEIYNITDGEETLPDNFSLYSSKTI